MHQARGGRAGDVGRMGLTVGPDSSTERLARCRGAGENDGQPPWAMQIPDTAASRHPCVGTVAGAFQPSS